MKRDAVALLALAGLVAIGAALMTRKWITPGKGKVYEPWFQQSSERWGLPSGLLSRVAFQESGYDPHAFNSKSGAAGLMQIVERWHPEVDPYDVEAAIDYAAKYLRENFDRFRTWELALAAYNAGPGNVSTYKGVPPFRETQEYVRAILHDVGLA